MKEFLDNLYNASATNQDLAIDECWQTIPQLARENKFDIINQLIIDLDLSRLDGSVIFGLIHVTSPYINYLPFYKKFYSNVREEYARRGESSKRISNLFDKYENGGICNYDPTAPEYKSHEEKFMDKIDAKLESARELGDKDLIDIISYYKSRLMAGESKSQKFRDLNRLLGEDELRKQTIESLREVANLLEKTTGGWPGIYYCDLPKKPLLNDHFIDGIEVVLSYPWPG